MLKKIISIGMIVLLTFVMFACGNSGGTQVSDDGNIYFYKNGTKVSGWVDCEDGARRYFDTNDYHALKGWQTIDGKYYYFAEDSGIQIKDGWSNDGYYLLENGEVATGNGNGYAITINNNQDKYNEDLNELTVGTTIFFHILRVHGVDTENIKYIITEPDGASSNGDASISGGDVLTLKIDNFNKLGKVTIRVDNSNGLLLVEKSINIVNHSTTNNNSQETTVNNSEQKDNNNSSENLYTVYGKVNNSIKKEKGVKISSCCIVGINRAYENTLPIKTLKNTGYRVQFDIENTNSKQCYCTVVFSVSGQSSKVLEQKITLDAKQKGTFTSGMIQEQWNKVMEYQECQFNNVKIQKIDVTLIE